MDKSLYNALLSLGCDDKEIRLFLACYHKGPSSLSELMKEARLQRSTAYIVMDSLIEKGLASEDHKTYGKVFTAVEPEELVRMVAAKQRQIGRRRIALEDHLAELQSMYRASSVTPVVKTYQGLNGLLAVWRDIITAQGEILLWTNQATESRLFSTVQHKEFIAERLERQLPIRVLAVANERGQELAKQDSESLRTTKLLPDSVDFSAETYIYNHKVAVLDYTQDIMGIITESTAVATAHRAMFEAAWTSL